jgi:hypothetical protein
MNEHFKKHLEASYTKAFEECARTGHKVGDLDAIFNSIAMATFAELIVQECANVCEGVTKEGEPLHLVSLGYSQNIKKHFGIEE